MAPSSSPQWSLTRAPGQGRGSSARGACSGHAGPRPAAARPHGPGEVSARANSLCAWNSDAERPTGGGDAMSIRARAVPAPRPLPRSAPGLVPAVAPDRRRRPSGALRGRRDGAARGCSCTGGGGVTTPTRGRCAPLVELAEPGRLRRGHDERRGPDDARRADGCLTRQQGRRSRVTDRDLATLSQGAEPLHGGPVKTPAALDAKAAARLGGRARARPGRDRGVDERTGLDRGRPGRGSAPALATMFGPSSARSGWPTNRPCSADLLGARAGAGPGRTGSTSGVTGP